MVMLVLWLRLWCLCNKIFVPAWNLFSLNLFTENLFRRNFLNEKLVPGTYCLGKWIQPIWNLFWYLFHDQHWNLFRNEHYTTKTIISFFVRQSFIFSSNIWLFSRHRQWYKIPNGIKNKYEFICTILHMYLGLSAKWKANTYN